MGELIINKLVFYSKNSMRIRFKILNLIRGMILKFYNPIVKVQIGDKLLLGIITEFPIVNKILKVKIDEDIHDLEILNSEVPPLLVTEDNFCVYDASDETLFILNIDKLTYNEIKPSSYNYLELLRVLYNNSYVIFKSREKLKEFIEEYMKNTDD